MKSTDISLVRTPEGLALTDGNLSLRGDFASMLRRIQKANLQQELLVKAVKIKGSDHQLTVLDAAAGLGEDAFLLAAAGHRVIMYERDEIIGALLEDALSRAAEGNDLTLRSIAGNMELKLADSIKAMQNLDIAPDVIYLDPMFPQRRKKNLVKKKFQLMSRLEAPCPDEEELFEAAVNARPFKIVVKRPVKGPYLAGKKPDYSFMGKAVRYDCFVLNVARNESERR